MNLVSFIFIVFLFVVLTPSNFIRLPQKGNKWIVSIVHGIIFAIILHCTYHYIMSLGSIVEGRRNRRQTKPTCNTYCGATSGRSLNRDCIKSLKGYGCYK